jgi:hypothetical protein
VHFAAIVHSSQLIRSCISFRTTEPAEMAAAVFAPSASLVSAPKAVVSRKNIAGAAGECCPCMYRLADPWGLGCAFHHFRGLTLAALFGQQHSRRRSLEVVRESLIVLHFLCMLCSCSPCYPPSPVPREPDSQRQVHPGRGLQFNQ